MDLARDFAKLTDKLKHSREISVEIRTLESEEEIFSAGLAAKALSYIGQIRMEGTVHLALAELLSNAEKAALKRCHADHFEKTGDHDGEEFLRSFHRKLREDLRSLRAVLQKSKPTFEVRMKIADQELHIEVRSNLMPTPREDSQIHRALDSARRAQSLNDIAGLPSTLESEGKGLATASLSLRLAGAGSIAYSIEGGGACLKFSVKAAQPGEAEVTRINNLLLSEVESLPAFPQNIHRLIDLCNSPDTDLRTIAAEIGKDQVIAGQLIRIANSGGFAGGRVADITEAAKILGMSNISGLLLRTGAYTILDEKYGVTEEMLTHPVRVAVYSRTLARKFKLGAIADQAYVAGLLHDIGKIVLIHHEKHTGILTAVEKTSRFRDRRSQVNLEELACGADHALVGKLLGKKWNFPDDLCEAIGAHHSPLGAPAHLRKLAFTIYMANAMADYEEGQTEFYSIEPEALAFFNLTTIQAFQMIAGALNSEFVSGS